MIESDLSKLKVLDVDLKAIYQIRNLEQAREALMFFILEEVKETILDFQQENVNITYQYNHNMNMEWLNITFFNVKLSNSQLNKWKSGIKQEVEVILKLSWNIIVNKFSM